MTLLSISETAWQFLLWVNTSLTTTGCLLTVGFLLCVLGILKTARQYRMAAEANRLIHATEHSDMHAVAGEDVVAAQLDLARAYIEMGNKPQAASLLAKLNGQGSDRQQQEARRLLAESY